MRITCVVGTRPEVIKMAPVIQELNRRDMAEVTVLSTAQHRHMVDPFLGFFGLKADIDLDAMTVGQTLPELTGRLLTRLSAVIEDTRPDMVLAQGDTTTVMTTAMACFYAGVRFGHIEAGLRTGDLRSPFPEEYNRRLATLTADLNFAPTTAARENLLREGVAADRIVFTGNTVIDALLWTVAHDPPSPIALAPGQRLLLMTLHRRESFGAPVRDVLSAVRRLVERNPDLVVLYPVHPNPNVAVPAREILDGVERVHLRGPLDYPDLVGAMRQAHLILTDSGGIQEEAPALAKPVLVTRDTTERPEAVAEGVVRVIGADPDRVESEAQRLLDDPAAYAAMARGVSPYGDGKAAGRIVDAVLAAGAWKDLS
jgi:UDP-N-acetylglucosamine 2-epimerase (non-hydrolysing)